MNIGETEEVCAKSVSVSGLAPEGVPKIVVWCVAATPVIISSVIS